MFGILVRFERKIISVNIGQIDISRNPEFTVFLLIQMLCSSSTTHFADSADAQFGGR